MNTMTTANRFLGSIAAALFGALSASLATLPAAAASFEPLKQTVKFGDLDISHPNGAAVLYGRIRTAAESVCSPFESSGGLSAQMQRNACINRAVADAVTAVNAPALLAVYIARTGKTLRSQIASLHADTDTKKPR